MSRFTLPVTDRLYVLIKSGKQGKFRWHIEHHTVDENGEADVKVVFLPPVSCAFALSAEAESNWRDLEIMLGVKEPLPLAAPDDPSRK